MRNLRRWKIFATSALFTLLAVIVIGSVLYAVNGKFGSEAREAAGQQEIGSWMGESIPDEGQQTAEADPAPSLAVSPAPGDEQKASQETLVPGSQEITGESENNSLDPTEPEEETGEPEEPTPTPFVCPKPEGLTWPDSALEDDRIIIVLDAGHGGVDTGTIKKDKTVYEKDINLSIVKKMQPLMEDRGVTVILTRDEDEFVSLEDRAKICNAHFTDVFVSIHVNSYESSKIGGLECYYYGESKACKALAEDVVSHLKTQKDIPMRGLREQEYYVLRHTACPAILVETGYLTNQKDASNLLSDEFQDKLAQALVDGILNPLGY